MRLIDAEALDEKMLKRLEELRTIDKSLNRHYSDAFVEAIAIFVRSAPTIDAVEVVRCKDCKYKCDASKFVYQHCELTGEVVRNFDYCSRGERKVDT